MQKMQKVQKLLIVPSLIGFVVSGCAAVQQKEDRTRGMSATALLEQATSSSTSGQYDNAIELYDKVQARFPQGASAQQAQLAIIYNYYKDQEADKAIAAADAFIKAYPRHPNVDYAWYMRAVSNFNRANNLADRLLPPDQTKVDSKQLQQSYQDFNTLLAQFPDSIYAEDASKRMRYLRNTLAQHEVNVADFYLRRKAYVAAANRAQQAIKHYNDTPAIQDALYIQVVAYRALNLPVLANDAQRVLALNFPNDTRLRDE